MLPFCEENTNLLKETDIYADYLIKYNKQLLENLSASYIYIWLWSCIQTSIFRSIHLWAKEENNYYYS